jgi:hypothetical protein
MLNQKGSKVNQLWPILRCSALSWKYCEGTDKNYKTLQHTNHACKSLLRDFTQTR